MFCDVLIKNASVITMNDDFPRVNWLAVKDDKIVALGNDMKMPEAVHVYDLKGKTVLPGFIDTHIHGTLTGEFLKSIDLNGAKDAKAVIGSIEAGMDKSAEIITAGCFSKEGYTGKMFTGTFLPSITSPFS